MTRKTFFKALVGIPLATAVRLIAETPTIQVFKTPTCGCCGNWVKHLQANGFEVSVEDVPDTGVYRRKYGVPEKLLSCHTGVVDGYALEGHVPALHGAAWLLFVTDEDDPFFEDGARRLGALSGDLSTCPLWHVPGYPAFVVTSPKLVDPSDVATRIHQLSGAVGATLRTARTLPR